MTKGILGKKVGMTQIFTEAGEFIPVTVIEATPNVVQVQWDLLRLTVFSKTNTWQDVWVATV